MAKKRGRKPFRPTDALRRDVEIYVGGGMSQDAIARAIGCSTPTLVKYFSDELANGAARRRAAALKKLDKAAREGKVNAILKLEAMARMTVAAGSAHSAAPAPQPAEALGKKDQAKVEAAVATSGVDDEWGNDLRLRTRH